MPIDWEEYGRVHDAFVKAENKEKDALNDEATTEYIYHYLLTESYKAAFEAIATLAPAANKENDQDHGVARTLQASFVEKINRLVEKIRSVEAQPHFSCNNGFNTGLSRLAPLSMAFNPINQDVLLTGQPQQQQQQQKPHAGAIASASPPTGQQQPSAGSSASALPLTGQQQPSAGSSASRKLAPTGLRFPALASAPSSLRQQQQQQQQQATGGASTQAFASDPSSLQQQQQQQATDGASASAFSPTGMPPHQPTAGLRSAFARAPSSLQQQQQQATGGASAQAFASDPSSLQQQQQQQQATGGASAQAFAQQPSTASRLRFSNPLVTPPSASGRAPGGSGGSSGFGQAGSVGQQEPQAKIGRMSHYEAAVQVQDGDPFGDIASGGPGRATLLSVSGITPKLPDPAVAAVSRKKRKQASRDGALAD